jgi:hypothetical protein
MQIRVLGRVRAHSEFMITLDKQIDHCRNVFPLSGCQLQDSITGTFGVDRCPGPAFAAVLQETATDINNKLAGISGRHERYS